MSKETLRLRMFAGPNGSGKSTFKSIIRSELLGILSILMKSKNKSKIMIF